MRTSDMIKSKFWRAGDVMGQPPKLLTIADVTEEVFSRGSKNEVKCYLWFSETLKGLQLNKTRVRLLEGAYGPDSDLWVGKRVRISYDPAVEFGGRAVGGVRLETPAGVVYRPSEAHNGWADAPVNGAARPPAPVWDEKRQIWVTPPQSAPSAAPASAPRPPPPVWNEATKAWETVDGATGEIKGAPGAEFDKALGVDSGGASAEFDDKIPF
jgi:hypothetical protein